MQIGAMLLFAMLVVSMATYQVTVVPSQNAEVEFNHNQQVHGQLQETRDAVLRTGAMGTSQPTAVDLGTQFPSRTVFINPPPPSGTLATTDLGGVTIANATATGEVGDYWDGSDRDFPTSGFTYVPDYSEYQQPPTTVYEHSVLYDRFADGAEMAKTGQELVDGRRINFVTLAGDVSTTQSRAVSLEPRPVSASTRTVSVSADGTAPVTVTLRTALSEETWRDLLKDEFDFGEGTAVHIATGFEDGTLPAGWTKDMAHGSAGVDSADPGTGTYSAFISGRGSVFTPASDTTGGGSIELSYWVKMDEEHPPESDQNEDLFVEYLDSTGTWVQIARYDSHSVSPGTTFDEAYTITDSKAFHSGFKVRFRQEDASSDDYWYFDDVELTSGAGADLSNDRYVSGFDFDSTTSPNTMTLTFERGVSYDLKLSKVGVGSGVTDTKSTYVVPVSGDDLPLSPGDARRFTVEVRDEYNNPVSGEQVSWDGAALGGTATSTTGPDGRATLDYTISQGTNAHTLTARIDGNATEAERARFSVTPMATTAESYDADLMSYWRFDENSGSVAQDAAGSNDGTVNGATLGQPGVAGTSYDFDGTGDHVDIGTPDVSGSAVTISAWVWSDSMSSSSADMRIVTKATGQSTSEHWWQIAEAGGQLRFRLKNEHNGGPDMVTDELSGGTLPDSQWVHVAATYDGSHMRIYVDGNEVNSVAEDGAIATDGTVGAAIGAHPGSSAQPFDGRIDEVRIYTRALTADEIRQQYEDDAPA